MASKPVTIKILGDASSLQKALGKAESGLGAFAGKAGASLKIMTAAAGAFAAVAGKAAVDFQDDMAQVFTLLPGVSGPAMSEMSDQVLEFSKKIGILPDEIIPGIYDALSAGVPQKNLFEFMEVAGRAAIGGNLEVADAVDLLSTAVNAYAETGLSAAEASDIFFTTVRLGKTTVPELQAAFSKVGPVAAALGIGLEEIGAGMSVLTAGGEPTSSAATKMAAALAELGKDGTKASKSFEDLSGVVFSDFVAQGGTFTEAVGIMSDSGLSFLDMFSSKEAAFGAMGLAVDDAESLQAALAEMNGAAGATDSAYEMMSGTVQFSIEKIKASVSAITIQLGSKFLPVLAVVAGYIAANLPKWETMFGNFVGNVVDLFDKMKGPVVEAFDFVVSSFRDNWKTIQKVVDSVVGVLTKKVFPKLLKAFYKIKATVSDTVLPALSTAFDAVKGAAVVAFDYIKDTVLPALSTAFETVKGALVNYVFPALVAAFDSVLAAAVAVYDWVVANWETIKETIVSAFDLIVESGKKVVDSLVTFVEKLVAVGKWVKDNDPAIAAIATVIGVVLVKSLVQATVAVWAKVAALYAQAAAFVAANATLIIVVAALAAFAAAVVWAYQNVGWFRETVLALKDAAVVVFGWLKVKVPEVIEVIVSALSWVVEKLVEFVGLFQTAWANWGDYIMEKVNTVWGSIKEYVSAAFNVLVETFNTFKALFTGDWGALWDGIVATVRAVGVLIKAAFKLAWSVAKVGFVFVWDAMKLLASEAFDKIVEFAKASPGLLKDGILLGAGLLYDAGTAIIGKLKDGVVDKFKEIIAYVEGKIKWLGEQLEKGKGLLNWIPGVNIGGDDGFKSEGTQTWAAGVIDGPSDQEKAWNAANGKQHGGPLRNGLSLVGERGPELLRMNQFGGASVVANQDMSGAGVGGDVIVNVSTNADPWAIGSAVAWELRRAG